MVRGRKRVDVRGAEPTADLAALAEGLWPLVDAGDDIPGVVFGFGTDQGYGGELAEPVDEQDQGDDEYDDDQPVGPLPDPQLHTQGNT
jgi:hypothetical protein